MFASHHESDLGEQNCLYCQKVSRQYRNVPPSNFVELLGHRSLEQSDKTAVTFLLDGENVTESLTYKDLDGRARTLAVRLLEEISPGDRVLILQPPGVEFVVSFFGCLYAGVVAVATYPPHKQRQVSRIEAIFEDAQPQMVLTSKALLSRMNSWLGKRAERLRAIYTEELATAGSDGWQSPVLRPETLALLQYTSGSTGTPRGVMVTHGNIMANEEMIRQTFGQHEESSVVSWLPIYHDMGLIGNLLQPLYLGTSTVLMSPASFLQKPVRWLSAVSRFRARTTGGPNFAFDLCARAVTKEQKAGLDLSCLELLYSGAEPIEASVLDRFAAAFRECGLRREALFACYGLAEATVLATGGGLRTGPNYLQVDTDLLQSGRGVPVTFLISAARPWLAAASLRLVRTFALSIQSRKESYRKVKSARSGSAVRTSRLATGATMPIPASFAAQASRTVKKVFFEPVTLVSCMPASFM